MNISLSSPTDYKDILNFWSIIFTEMGWKGSVTDEFDDIPTFFHLPEGFLLGVKNDKGKLVGCAGVQPLHNTIGIIKRFYIAADLRGKGVAKQLLDEIYKIGKKKKFTKFVLDVYYTNQRAKRFYEKNGFLLYTPDPDPLWQESLAPDKFSYYYRDITDV